MKLCPKTDQACAKGCPDDGCALIVVAASQREMINHPSHYGGDTPYEVIKVLEAWLSPQELSGFMKGTAITYIARAGKKEGNPELQEMKKAAWYINRRIYQLEKS